MNHLLHALRAAGAGLGAMACLIALTTMLTRWLVPAWSATPPSRGARVFNLVATCLYAAVGGRITAVLAPPASPLWLGLILSLIVLLLSTAATAEFRGLRLGWYPLALAVLPAVATLGAAILTTLYH